MYFFLSLLFLAKEVRHIHGSMIDETELPSVSNLNSPNICKVLFVNTNATTGYRAAFQEIGQHKFLEEMIAFTNDFPANLIRFNKDILSEYFRLDGLLDTEIHSCALMFYQRLGELYEVSPSDVSFEIVDQYLQELTICILKFGTRYQTFVYSTPELRRCFRLNDLASHSLDIFGDLSVKWFGKLSPGLTWYLNLRRRLELTEVSLNSGPGRSCQKAMTDLKVGCEKIKECFASNSKQQCVSVCNGYCVNIIRGCLAPSLFSSSEQSTALTEESMWSYKNSLNISALFASLNATTIYNLIRKGIHEVKENIASIKIKLEQFCGKSRSRTLKQSSDLSNGLYHNGSEKNRLEFIRDVNPNHATYSRLTNFITEATNNFSFFFHHRGNIRRYMDNTELLYCPKLSEKQCWNGSTFGRYTKKVPEFTINGQLNNPEVKVTGGEIRLQTSQERNTGRKQPSTDNLFHKVNPRNRSVSPSIDIELNYSEIKNQFDEESSGLHPQFSTTDLEIPRVEQFIAGSQEPKVIANVDHTSDDSASESLPDNIVVQGCFADDEDCDGLYEGRKSKPMEKPETIAKQSINSSAVSRSSALRLRHNTGPMNKTFYRLIKFLGIFLSLTFSMHT
uniref:Uncharacterized protein n=1 Tax=Trichobilharzia regenti TaxID=157069 RepID=A0AA85J8D3_TRIRE|nr:unnamed protein product [Trichobilharzia regenti]